MASVNVAVAVLLLLLIIILLVQLILKPVKLLWKIIFNSLIGLGLLMLFNYAAGFIGFSLPINIITILIAGFLGVPGIILLLCFYILLL
jgi:inhibitor of the pro-sigma K processing machinery